MDTFSLYDNLPLFSGDLLVGWNPLADELPSLVQDEFQQDQQMYTTLLLDDLVKGNQEQVPTEINERHENVLESALVNTKVNLVDFLQENTPQPPISPQITEEVNFDVETRAEDLLQNVSELLVVNLSSNTSNIDTSSTLDLSSLGDLTGESGMLGDDEVDSILSGSDFSVEVDHLFTSTSAEVLTKNILSPVSPDDVDRILSSSPASPYDASVSSPSSSIMYSSNLASPCSIDMDTSFEAETSVDDSNSTISMKYLREELLKPTPSPNYDESDTIKLGSRKRSPRRRVKYEPYSPPPIERYQRNTSSHAKIESYKPGEQRKQRKKQQNKDAALRYRQKKRDEKMTVGKECEVLESKNDELRDKVDSMTREIQYLKDLLSEVYKAKAASKKTL